MTTEKARQGSNMLPTMHHNFNQNNYAIGEAAETGLWSPLNRTVQQITLKYILIHQRLEQLLRIEFIPRFLE